jgi:RNA recognition motif-containing protein
MDTDSKTLWIGDLDPWMDETYLHNLFSGISAVESVKVMRDKGTHVAAGYGFVEFANHSSAMRGLEAFQGHPMPGSSNKTFRLNWGSADKR